MASPMPPYPPGMNTTLSCMSKRSVSSAAKSMVGVMRFMGKRPPQTAPFDSARLRFATPVLSLVEGLRTNGFQTLSPFALSPSTRLRTGVAKRSRRTRFDSSAAPSRVCQNPNFGARKANPSFPRKRESRGPGGVPTRCFPTPPRLDSRFRGNDDFGRRCLLRMEF